MRAASPITLSLYALCVFACSSDAPAPLSVDDLDSEQSSQSSALTVRSTTAGTRVDSLVAPTYMEVPPEASFVVEGVSEGRHASLSAVLRAVDGKVIDLVGPRFLDDGRAEFKVEQALERGTFYDLRLSLQRRTRSLHVAKVHVAVPQAGAIASYEVDIDADGLEDRVVVYADGRLGLASRRGKHIELVLPGMADLRASALADFNRDGRADIALVGNRSEGGAVLSILTNSTSTGDERPSFEVKVQTYEDLNLPIGLATADLERDGIRELAILTMSGELILVRGPASDQPFFQTLRLRGDIGLGMGLEAYSDTELLISASAGGRLVAFDQGEMVVTRLQAPVIPRSAGARLRAGIIKGRDPVVVAYNRNEVRTWTLVGRQWEQAGIHCSECEDLTSATLVDGMNDGYYDVMIAQLREQNSELHRFSQHAGGFERQSETTLLEESGRINRLDYAAKANALLISTESGLIELSLNPRPDKPDLSFDTRIHFSPPKFVGSLPPMQHYVLADFDGDGFHDIAGFDSSDGILYAWFNDIAEGGGLVRRQLGQEQDQYERLVAVDANRDGFADLLLVPSGAGDAGRLLQSRGKSRFFDEQDESAFLVSAPSGVIGAPVVADFNGDGFDDLFWPTSETGALSLGDEERFHDALVLPAAPLDQNGEGFEMDGRFVLADVFEGGRPDIIATGRAGGFVRAAYYRNRLSYDEEVNAAFEGKVLPGSFVEISHLVVGEFMPGVLGAAAIAKSARYGWGLVVWSSIENEPEIVSIFGIDQPHSLNAFDVDRDGDADVALVPWSGADSIMLLINGGDGKRFSDQTITSSALSSMRFGSGALGEVRLVDLDGDGFPDILAQEGLNGDVHHTQPK